MIRKMASTLVRVRKFYPLVLLYIALVGLMVLSPTGAALAQGQCGVVQTINFPLDPGLFMIAQDFGALSPRHQGRYHTGEDWYGGRDNTYLQPVHAIAAGRVTYSSPIGWGRDLGVVIIEHTFPDGTVMYSQYGHMVETDTIHFPAPYACVEVGEVIGAMGDPRPAPHLHFEMRVNNPSTPGPGYSWENPISEGYRKASKYILNWQTWLQPAYLWHLDIADENGPISPPVELEDHSLIYVDADRLARVTPDGRLLWRINLDKPAAGVAASDYGALLVFTDGAMQAVNRDGTLGESWDTGIVLESPAFVAGDLLLFHTPDNALVAFGQDRRALAWRLEDVPPVVYAQLAQQTIGIVTANNELLTLSPQGALLDRANIQAGTLTASANGVLMAYTQRGLWTIDGTGTWALVMENAPSGAAARASVLSTADGQLYTFDGQTLYAYSSGNTPLWQVTLPGVQGITQLSDADTAVLLTSNDGHIIAVQKSSGGVCNSTRIYGSRRNHLWQSLGDDGILRLAVADQLLALDWQEFLGGCRE